MQKITVKIDGMACGMCESHVNEAIRKAFPVQKVTSSHRKGEAVILSENAIDETTLREALAPPADAEPGVGLPSTEHVICGNAIHKVTDEQVWQPWRERYDYSLSSGAWASRS